MGMFIDILYKIEKVYQGRQGIFQMTDVRGQRSEGRREKGEG
jgi:hypothetical protein